jgi:diaminopimelate decarboxylase/aspartate kinase
MQEFWFTSTRYVIVVSAIGKTTNKILKYIDSIDQNFVYEIRDMHLKIARQYEIDTKILIEKLGQFNEVAHKYELLAKLPDCTKEQLTQLRITLLSYGEILSSIVLTGILKKNNIHVILLDSHKFIKSINNSDMIDDSNLHMTGEFYCDTDVLSTYITNTCQFYVTQGFIATTKDNKNCVLTRSGSDTSAAIIASSMKAKCLEIWTDVSGMYTADPRVVPEAHVIEKIDYDKCQEASAAGSHVLHPQCILPCKRAKIPIHVRNTFNPTGIYTTVIDLKTDESSEEIYTIAKHDNITLFKIKNYNMWNSHGFMSKIFRVFGEQCVNVDIVTSSQFSISTTTEEQSIEKIEEVCDILGKEFDVQVVTGCTIVSIIADNVKTNKRIHDEMKTINKLCEDHLHIKHYSDNDTSLSFVVDSEIGNALTRALHREFIKSQNVQKDNLNIWWRSHLSTFNCPTLKQSFEGEALYMYDGGTIKSKCIDLKTNLSPTINRFYYAMKANDNADVIKEIVSQGFKLECVSIEEVRYATKFIKPSKNNILFSPNYCAIEEYIEAFKLGVMVVVDNVNLIVDHSSVFSKKAFGVRLDLNQGNGHHKKVITEGSDVKFGMPLYEVGILCDILKRIDSRIVLLHSHKGSGILDHTAWANTLQNMNKIVNKFPHLQTIDLGGGLGIYTNGKTLDLKLMRECIDKVHIHKDIELVIEPGRYLVAEAGVLITQVTQVREKIGKRKKKCFIGVTAGMNAIIRPMLYGAYHPIYNVTKIDAKKVMIADIVGPICESSDVIGKDREMQETDVGDMIIIENAGAYCRTMASRYNRKNIPEVMYKPS